MEKERKTGFHSTYITEVHVIRRMFNLDIYVIKCPAKAERKPLVLMLGLGFVLLVVVVCLTFLFGLGWGSWFCFFGG